MDAQSRLGGEEITQPTRAGGDDQRAAGHPFLFKPGRAGPPPLDVFGKKRDSFDAVSQVTAMQHFQTIRGQNHPNDVERMQELDGIANG